MRRWLRFAVWVAGPILAYCCTSVSAQRTAPLAPAALQQADLPDLNETDDEVQLSPAEELPPADPSRLVSDVDPDAAEELPPALPMRETADFSSTSDREMSLDQQDFGPESDLAAELIPQETIRERYPDGSVKVERGVTQDERENYVNHGPWRSWDESGNLIAEGHYRFGQRHGRWVRWYQQGDAELFSQPPFNLFNGPYVSQASFVDGELEGQWVISDRAELRICEWSFTAGRRHGESIWYYHTGRKMRVLNYRAGELHGELLEWDVDGNPVTRVEYIEGRRHEKTQQEFADGQKKVEGMVLQARLIMKQPDDWWEATMATYVAKGTDQKHGEWKAWYPSGQQRFEGSYQYDLPAGDFTWYHPNGQKSLKAFYDQGAKQGQWTWWHPNGQKSIQGQYRDDSATERWVWWHDTGKVAQRVDFSQAGSPLVGGRSSANGESVLLRQSIP